MIRKRGPLWWRVMLALLPGEFRERHAEEMKGLLEEHLGGRGPLGRMRVRLSVIADTLLAAARLRRTGRREGRTMFEVVRTDLAFAARALARRPSFTVVAVATLGIGIGANTTIFSVVNGVLLEPLPYPDSDRIGILWHELGQGAQNLPALHALDLRDYRDRSEIFEDFTMASGREWILGGQDDPELVDAGFVEAGFFEFFGAAPAVGRTISHEDDEPGVAPVVVLSHRLWRRRFGGDPGIVGSTIELAGMHMEVVGVAPEWFRLELPAEAFLLRDAEVWVSLRLDSARQPPRNYTVYTGFGRLRPGATFAQAQEELEVLEAQLKTEHPVHAASDLQVRVVPLLQDVVKGAERDLLLLLGAVGFVLLIACANVSNLLLVRGRSRARELAVRAALGSGRAGLLRLAFAESLLLGLAGAAVGMALTGASLELLAALGHSSVPRLDAVRVDAPVLGFLLALTGASTLVFGLLPALRASAGDPADMLAGDARAGSRRGFGRFRDSLVVFEIAASVVLLVGTGLMIRSFVSLGAADPGFSTDSALTFRVALPASSFRTSDSRVVVQEQIIDQISALPGVERVSAVSQLPLTGSGPLQPYAYDEETATNWESVTADRRWVAPGFFDAIGARLIEGRALTRDDAGLPFIVIDDRLAERAFPGVSALGRRLQVNPDTEPEEIRYAQVVGVVAHLRLHELGRPHLTQIYWADAGLPQFSVVVRTAGNPEAVAPAVRDVVRRLAPGAPMEDVRTLADLANGSLAAPRLALVLMTLFGVTAVLLACIGIYGVLSNLVAMQRREIGVRMALGQTPGRARGWVVGVGMRLVGGALLVGLGAALPLSHLLASRLYGVGPGDPATYAAVCVVLLSVALLACWIPARRATGVDPSEALRAE